MRVCSSMFLYGSEAQDILVLTVIFLFSAFLEKLGSQTSILSLNLSGRLSLSRFHSCSQLPWRAPGATRLSDGTGSRSVCRRPVFELGYTRALSDGAG